MLSCTLQLLTRSLAIDTILQKGKFVVQPWLTLSHARSVHITSNVTKEYRIGSSKIRALPVGKDSKLEGESTVNVSAVAEASSLYPNMKTLSALYNGVPYDKLHIVNTLVLYIFYNVDNVPIGVPIIINSAGVEGFKNTRKGTNIAAQQTAITFCKNIIQNGVTTIKLRIQGIGPGRMGVLKGFELSGLNVVSITDDTRVSWNPPRPRKQRRI
ncbi:28S ribosomal protein S11, mitochondrial [Anthophora quadrimaculata]